MNNRKLFFVVFIYSLATFFSYSQLAELTTIIADPKERPATGMVLVDGSESNWNKNLEEGSAHFILKVQSGIEDVLHSSDIKVYPNPIRNGELHVSVPFGLDGGFIEFFNITGQNLGRVTLEAYNGLSFQVKPGIIFYRAFYNEEFHFGRIVNLGDFLQVKISEAPESLKPLKLFSLLDDQYNILYSDPDSDMDAVVVESVYIPIGTHKFLYLFPEFSTKTSWINFETNSKTNISIMSTIEIAYLFSQTGAEAVTLAERYSLHDGLDISISLTGEYTDTANIDLHIVPGEHYTIEQRRDAYYFVRIIGNGTTYSVYHEDNLLGTELVGNQISFKNPADQLFLKIITTGEGLFADTIEQWLGKGAVELYRGLDEMGEDTYEHTVTANVFSELSEKLIKDGSDGYMVKTNGDTLWTKVTNQQFSRTFTTINEYEDLIVGLKNVPGHQEVSSNETVGSLLTLSLTAGADEYFAQLEVDVVDSNEEAVANALVIHGSQQGNTDQDGNVIFTGIKLNTNIYNEFNGPYSTVTSVESTDQSIVFNKVNHSHQINIGDNYEKIQVGGQAEYSHTIHGLIISSITNKQIKDGSIAWYILAANPTDTVETDVIKESFEFTFISSKPNESITVGVKDIPGHNPVQGDFTVGASLDVTLTANGLQYLQTINIHVEDSDGNNLQYVEALVGGRTGFTDVDGNVSITDIVLLTNQYNEFASYNETASVSPSGQSEGFNTQTKTYIAQPGTTDIEFIVEVNTVYTHVLTIEVESSKFGKTIKDGSVAWFVLASNTTDTIKKGTSNEKAVFTFTTGNTSENLMVGVKLIPGHQEVQDNLTITDAQTASLTAQGFDYDAFLPVLVKDRRTDQVLEGAIIAGIGTAQTSASDGTASLTDENLATDVFNMPLSEYNSDVSINKSGYNTYTGTWVYHDGPNVLRTILLDPINEAPSVSGIPDLDFDEDESYTGLLLDTYVSDDFTADEDITWSYSGNTEVNVIIVNRTVSFTASQDWNGAEHIRFTARDEGGLTADQEILLTVNPVNDAPYRTNPISDQSIAEGETVTINWTNHVDDVDNTYPELSLNIANTTNFTYQINGNDLEITPVVGFSGTIFSIVIKVDDGDLDVDLEPFDIVVAQNIPPQISDIPEVIFDEDDSYTGLDLDDYVLDETPDWDIVWTYSGNTNVIVEIGTDHVVSFSAQADWFGEESLTFTAEDEQGSTSSKAIHVTVNPVNDPPYQTNLIPDQSIGEGETLTIFWILHTFDIDNPTTDLVVSILDSPNFSWVMNGFELEITPNAGVSSITGVVVNVRDLEPLDVDLKPFNINIQANESPVVGDLPDIEFDEDESDSSLNLDGYVSDDSTPDESIVWSYAGNTDVLVSIGTDRTVTFSATPNWNGSETIIFTAEDEGGLQTSRSLVVTVIPVNDAPEEILEIPDQSIEMNTYFEFDWTVYATDIDNLNSELVLSIAALPDAVFLQTGDLFRITPDTDYVGTITDIVINVSDGDLNTDLSPFNLEVTSSNQAPELADIADIEFDEDESDSSLDLDDIVTDDNTLDADILWTYSGNTEISVSIEATTRVVTFSASQDWNGNETITFTAEDEEGLTASKDVFVIVHPVNDPPHEIDPIGDRTIEINTWLEIDWTLFAGDVDNTSEELTLDIVALPNAGFTRSGDLLRITPDTDFVGVIENIIVNVADADDNIDLTAFSLTVTDDNQSPELTTIPDITFNEDETDSSLDLDDYVTDDKTAAADIVWTYSGNAEVTISIDPTSHVVTFGATPDWNGSETVTLTAEDEGGLQTGQNLLVTVLPINDPPEQILQIPDQSIDMNTFLELDWTPYAGDIDNTNPELTLSVASLPNAVFVHTGNLFRITPNTDFTGVISGIIINVADSEFNINLDAFKLTVVATNTAPKLSQMPDISFPEDETDSSLDLDDYVSDDFTVDADIVWSFSGNTEITVSIDQNSHVVTFGATPNWSGNEDITFTAMDEEGLTTSQTINVEVTPVNDAPIKLDPISEVTIDVNTYYEFDWTLHASDIDNLNSELVLTISALPNAVFLQTGDLFRITPDADYTGTISNIVINVSDLEPLDIDLDPFNLIVVAHNEAPIVSGMTDISFPEDGTHNTLDLDNFVTDDNTTVDNIVWTKSGNDNIYVSIDVVSHVVTFTALKDWNGNEDITFTAEDEEGLTAGQTINVTVTPVNDAPVFLPTIPDQYIWPLETVVIDLKPYFSDVDDATLTYSISGLDNGTADITNGILTITPTPAWTGEDIGLVITATDGEYPVDSNSFKMVVSDSDKAEVTFVFKSVSEDEVLEVLYDDTFTMRYKLLGETATTDVSSKDPTFTVNFDRGETYDLQAFWSESLESGLGYAGAFMFLKRPGDLEAFEQRAGTTSGDTEALVTFNNPTETIYVYKFMWDFPFSEMYGFVLTGDNGQADGTVKFSTADRNAPVWWDRAEGVASTSEHQVWMDELFTEFRAVPHVYLTFPYEEDASQPGSPHVSIQLKEGNPSFKGMFHTFYDVNNEITEAQVKCLPTVGERDFKLAIIESILNLNEEKNRPPFLEYTGDGYVLSEKGKKMISAVYLSKAGARIAL